MGSLPLPCGRTEATRPHRRVGASACQRVSYPLGSRPQLKPAPEIPKRPLAFPLSLDTVWNKFKENGSWQLGCGRLFCEGATPNPGR